VQFAIIKTRYNVVGLYVSEITESILKYWRFTGVLKATTETVQCQRWMVS